MRAGSTEALADSAPRSPPIRVTNGKIGLPNGTGFDRLLLECVDSSLEDLLGAKVRDAAYQVLKRNYSIAHDEIPQKPHEFGSSLEEVFGVAGKVIARAIVRRLYSQLGLQFVQRSDYEFQDYITAAKR